MSDKITPIEIERLKQLFPHADNEFKGAPVTPFYLWLHYFDSDPNNVNPPFICVSEMSPGDVEPEEGCTHDDVLKVRLDQFLLDGFCYRIQPYVANDGTVSSEELEVVIEDTENMAQMLESIARTVRNIPFAIPFRSTHEEPIK